MNISFFFLIIVLFALAFLTSWNPHVLLLLGVTTLLWGAMVWYVLVAAIYAVATSRGRTTELTIPRFVIELTKMQLRTDNMPPGDPNAAPADNAEKEESKKNQ